MKKFFDISMLPEEVSKKLFLQKARDTQSWTMQANYLSYAASYLLILHQKARDKQIKLLQEEMKKNGGKLKNGSRLATKQEMKLIYDSSVISVYRMLMGYSIENLAKAFLISAYPNLIDDNGIVSKSIIDSHLSLSMVKKCGIKLSAKEKNVIKMLGWYIVWAGRYPVPLKTKHIKPYKRFDGLWFFPGDLQIADEVKIIDDLRIRLVRILKNGK